MGAAASVDHAIGEEEAKTLSGDKYDEGKWGELVKGEDGTVAAEAWNVRLS